MVQFFFMIFWFNCSFTARSHHIKICFLSSVPSKISPDLHSQNSTCKMEFCRNLPEFSLLSCIIFSIQYTNNHLLSFLISFPLDCIFVNHLQHRYRKKTTPPKNHNLFLKKLSQPIQYPSSLLAPILLPQ